MVGSLTEVAVIVAISVSPGEAEGGTSTSTLNVTDSPSEMVPVLSMDRFVGQALPETERSKLSSLPILLVTWSV